jgi:hypothetical protein
MVPRIGAKHQTFDSSLYSRLAKNPVAVEKLDLSKLAEKTLR